MNASSTAALNLSVVGRYIERMPVPSSVVRHITRIINDPEASATAIAEAVRLDPAFGAKVLRLANSAYIGLPRRISSLPHAVALLGIKRIYSIVLASELITPLNRSKTLPFSFDRFRSHAVITAFIAEAIAKNLKRYSALDEHEIFSGALLHDIGKLLAGTIDPAGMKAIHERCTELSIPYYRAESDEFSHTVIGAMLAQRWQLPEELAACIRGHHAAACFPQLHRMVSVIHIADVMAHLLGYPLYPDEKTPAIDDAALAAVQLPVERLRVIAGDILQRQEQIASLLELFNE